MQAVATARHPTFWTQHLAVLFFGEPAGMLLLYAAALIVIARAPRRAFIGMVVLVCGLGAAAVEIVNVSLENFSPTIWHGAAVSITFMLIPFLVWSLGAVFAVHRSRRLSLGILASVLSAGLCTLLSVTAGFVIELFLAPPPPAAVVVWAEFRRSGWTDPRAFAIANTFDSGFTHLLLAPVIAAILGTVAGALALIARRGDVALRMRS